MKISHKQITIFFKYKVISKKDGDCKLLYISITRIEFILIIENSVKLYRSRKYKSGIIKFEMFYFWVTISIIFSFLVPSLFIKPNSVLL